MSWSSSGPRWNGYRTHYSRYDPSHPQASRERSGYRSPKRSAGPSGGFRNDARRQSVGSSHGSSNDSGFGRGSPRSSRSHATSRTSARPSRSNKSRSRRSRTPERRSEFRDARKRGAEKDEPRSRLHSKPKPLTPRPTHLSKHARKCLDMQPNMSSADRQKYMEMVNQYEEEVDDYSRRSSKPYSSSSRVDIKARADSLGSKVNAKAINDDEEDDDVKIVDEIILRPMMKPLIRRNAGCLSFADRVFCLIDVRRVSNVPNVPNDADVTMMKNAERVKKQLAGCSTFEELKEKMSEVDVAQGMSVLLTNEQVASNIRLLQEQLWAKYGVPPITPSIQSTIDKALAVPDEAEVSRGFGNNVRGRDIRLLLPQGWLNDTLISYYFGLIQRRSEVSRGRLPKVYAFNTFFYQTLMENGHAGLRRWTDQVDLFTYDMIIIPVHLVDHWCLAVVDFRKAAARSSSRNKSRGSVTYYDSLGGTNPKGLKAIREYLRKEHFRKRGFSFDSSELSLVTAEDIPAQLNVCDCGVFCVKYAEYLARDANLNFSLETMPYFRAAMVYEIASRRLLVGG